MNQPYTNYALRWSSLRQRWVISQLIFQRGHGKVYGNLIEDLPKNWQLVAI